MKTPQDSTGKPIDIGDKVTHRGEVFTIKAFVPGLGIHGTSRILFEESDRTDADEISVDKINGITKG